MTPEQPVETSAAGAARALPVFAAAPVWAVAGGVATVLLALSGRYGYHRDELYFLASGRHLAWGYPDQPPLVPLLARVMSAVDPSSLVVLRLPATVAAAAVVVLTALLARELGGDRSSQLLAALVAGVSGIVLATGHLLSTTTFALLVWAALSWLAARALRTDDRRWWLLAGAVSGIGLLDSGLVALFLAAVVVGIALAGPRSLLRSGWVLGGALLALAMWSPYLVWQAAHGWPELAVAHSIAGGGSGTSAARTQVLPQQVVLVSPFLVPVWVAGLVRLLRNPGLAWCRGLGVAWFVLAALVIAGGGKPYYLAGMFPLLIASGAGACAEWMRRGRHRLRRSLLAGALVLSLVNLLIVLPVLPLGLLHRTPIVSINYDAGETVGWPAYVRQIASVYGSLPMLAKPDAAILASNYGEAGAVDRYGPAIGLPRAYSGHNGYWSWGRPPATTRVVVAVGYGRRQLLRWFRDVRLARRLDNRQQVDDDEQGAPVWVCAIPRAGWPVLWPKIKHYG